MNKKYQVITREDYFAFVKAVEESLEYGWVLYGPPFVSCGMWHQAMTFNVH